MSNKDKFPRSWMLGGQTQVQRPSSIKHRTSWSYTDGKKVYQKVCSMCKIVILLITVVIVVAKHPCVAWQRDRERAWTV